MFRLKKIKRGVIIDKVRHKIKMFSLINLDNLEIKKNQLVS